MHSRRRFLKGSGLGLLTFVVGGCAVDLSPRDARERRVPFTVLSQKEVSSLELLAEILLPGAAGAGIAHYVDHQLAASPDQQLLMIKYLNVNPPFAPFYQTGLAGLDRASLAMFDRSFEALATSQATQLIKQMTQINPIAWRGPPAPFFYFVIRSDAVDVVYGTQQGFEELGIPYMAHIEPPSRWGE